MHLCSVYVSLSTYLSDLVPYLASRRTDGSKSSSCQGRSSRCVVSRTAFMCLTAVLLRGWSCYLPIVTCRRKLRLARIKRCAPRLLYSREVEAPRWLLRVQVGTEACCAQRLQVLQSKPRCLVAACSSESQLDC
jgi:hypothetical protein